MAHDRCNYEISKKWKKMPGYIILHMCTLWLNDEQDTSEQVFLCVKFTRLIQKH